MFIIFTTEQNGSLFIHAETFHRIKKIWWRISINTFSFFLGTWSAHIELKENVRDLYRNLTPRYFYHFLDSKVALLSRVFLHMLYLKKEEKKSGTLFCIGVNYIADIISKFHENRPKSGENKLFKYQKSSQNTLLEKATWNIFGKSVFVCIHAFQLQDCEGCYPITLEQAISLLYQSAMMLEGKERTQFVSSKVEWLIRLIVPRLNM